MYRIDKMLVPMKSPMQIARKLGIKKDRLKKSAGLTTQKSNVQGKTKNI
jgi:hypothetical protein